jgi:hypothetical protein
MTEKPLSTPFAVAGLTVIVTSEVDVRAVSLAVSRNTYVPDVEKVARAVSEWTSSNVVVPGPLIWDHVVVSVLLGKPSSVAVAERCAPEGSVIV